MKNDRLSFREMIVVFLKGLFMGSADIIPGVSGGTIALITGIYERLIFALKGINFRFAFYFVNGFFNKKYFSQAKKSFLEIDFVFLVPLAGGVSVAFLVLARVLKIALTSFPAYTFAFFFGLILSSSLLVYQSIKNVRASSVVLGLCGFFGAFFFVGLNPLSGEHNLIVLFFSGVISFCAMILPGISGAFLLLFLGQYQHMLEALNQFWIPDMVSYVAGGLVGLLLFSRFLSFLLGKYRVGTLSFLLGLMLGALRLPGEEIMNNGGDMVLIFVSGFIGFVCVVFFAVFRLRVERQSHGSDGSG